MTLPFFDEDTVRDLLDPAALVPAMEQALVRFSKGTVVQPVGILLERAPIPFTGAVVRISDRDSALLQFLDGRGIRLDTMVDVVERRPFGGALVIRADGVETDLGAQAASSVWLSA